MACRLGLELLGSFVPSQALLSTWAYEPALAAAAVTRHKVAPPSAEDFTTLVMREWAANKVQARFRGWRGRRGLLTKPHYAAEVGGAEVLAHLHFVDQGRVHALTKARARAPGEIPASRQRKSAKDTRVSLLLRLPFACTPDLVLGQGCLGGGRGTVFWVFDDSLSL